MTVVPLPDGPTLRIRCVFSLPPSEGGIRFFHQYSGTAPSAATCATIATDIANLWVTDIAPLLPTDVILTEVDVLDITTASGASGTALVSHAGTRAGTGLPYQVAATVQDQIARRYRGGKPRTYFPAGVEADLLDQSHWLSAFLTSMNAGVLAFHTGIAALSVSGTTVGAHVNLSYYSGFTNITNSSGRTKAVPKYKATATHDVVTGYVTAARLSSQKRRRSATTP